jgi:hypothetical protein
MIDFSFRTWLNEWADFGLDRLPRGKVLDRPDTEEKPLQPLNIEYVCNYLGKHKLGVKEAYEPYFGELQWGTGPGAIKLVFGPWRGLRAVIRRESIDIKGQKKWLCKKVLEVRNYYDKHEDTLTQNLLKLLEEVDKGQIEAPDKDFNGLERLVLHMSHELRRNTSQRIFIYEGIRRIVTNEHYIIHFGCTGMGVQRLGQKRLDQLQLEVRHDKESGFIKVTLQEIGDKITSHGWKIDPPQFTEYYSPAQPREEIIGTVLSLLNSY